MRRSAIGTVTADMADDGWLLIAPPERQFGQRYRLTFECRP